MCVWGYTDCTNLNVKCDLCFTNGFHYVPVAVKKQTRRSSVKRSERPGSYFEQKNHQLNNMIINDVSSRMTPNSGAGHVKGDEQISGIIEVMEELKTKVATKSSGAKTFSIRKDWLDKLDKEARFAKKEFWYLKFSFHENDDDVYVVVGQDIIMSMVKTMIEDRRAVQKMRLEKEVLAKQLRKAEADLVAARAEIDFLKAKLKLVGLEEGGVYPVESKDCSAN